MTDLSLGERIRQLRTSQLPRLTQRELAERAGVSVDLISKLEQGVKQSALLVSLHKIARALDVDVSVLLAQPARVDTVSDGLDSGILAIRRAITTTQDMGEPASDDDLKRSAVVAWGHYWSSRFDTLGVVVPELVASARATVRELPSATAYAALSDAYGVAGSMLAHLGKVDLAYLTMERALEAAEHSEDGLRHSALLGWMSWLLLHQTGSCDEAKFIAMREADAIEPKMKRATPEEVSIWGVLLKSAAVAAAREDNASEADELINLAKVAATCLEGMGHANRIDYESPFGVGLVVMQSVDIAVVTGRPARALKLARSMPPEADLPLASRARHMADKAFAFTQLGKHQEAEETLLALRQLAPQWMTYQPYPRIIIRDLWEQHRRRRSSTLLELAQWLSVPLT